MSNVQLVRRGLDWREVGGQLIALDSERATYLSANPAGTLLWRALAEGSSEEELARLLVETYEVDPERASEDVSRFVADLARLGLLEADPV
jgi:Coenzyme PQQ synthesis protein D (PqqD)